MKKTINKNELYLKIFVFLEIVIWFFFDYFNTNFNDDYKYLFSIIVCAFCLFFIKSARSKEKQKFEIEIIQRLIIICFVFLGISYLFQIINTTFSILPLKYCFYIIMPSICVYAFISRSLDKANISNFFFKTLFYISMISFLILAKDILSLNNILSISFVDSYSPFEYIGMADIFLLLFCWFLYKKEYVYSFISGFITLLLFKRFHLVFMLIFILMIVFDKKKNSEKINKYAKYFFYLAPIVALMLYSSSFNDYFYSNFHIKLNDFSSGRYSLVNYLLDAIHNNVFINTGLGSTGYYISNITNHYVEYLHCDSLALAIETTYIGYLLYNNFLFKFTRKKYYSNLILIFLFSTMIVSTIITNFLTWLIFYFFLMGEGDSYEK